jgi:hypothetical protein
MLLKWHVTLLSQVREAEAHLKRLALLLTCREGWDEDVAVADKFFNIVPKAPK